jgi:hypothetical protein
MPQSSFGPTSIGGSFSRELTDPRWRAWFDRLKAAGVTGLADEAAGQALGTVTTESAGPARDVASMKPGQYLTKTATTDTNIRYGSPALRALTDMQNQGYQTHEDFMRRQRGTR